MIFQKNIFMSNISAVDIGNIIISAIAAISTFILGIKFWNCKSSCCGGNTALETTLSQDNESSKKVPDHHAPVEVVVEKDEPIKK